MPKQDQAIIQALNTAAEAARLASNVAAEAAKVNTATTVAIAEMKVSMSFFATQLDKIIDAQKGFVTRPEFEEVKKDFNRTVEEINKNFTQHNIDDKASFGGLAKGQDDLSKTVARWGGGIAVIIIVIGIAIPLILHFVK